MKFEPGKLVLLVRAGRPETQEYVGQVHVLGPASDIYDRCWELNPPMFARMDGCEVHWREQHMKIIDHPGDDAQDESLSWKKVPSADKREELA